MAERNAAARRRPCCSPAGSTRCAPRWRRRCCGRWLPLGGTPLYVASAGVRAAELDPFAVAAMAEIGIDIAGHRPITFEELEDLEGLNFDLIVTLSPEAHHKALALTHRLAAEVEYWPTADPADVEGNRAQRLDAYRAVRDQLMAAHPLALPRTPAARSPDGAQRNPGTPVPHFACAPCGLQPHGKAVVNATTFR